MGEIIAFPPLRHAVARPGWWARTILLAMGLAAMGGGVALFLRQPSLGGALGVVLGGWVAWYSQRCRLEVCAGGICFYGFLPARRVPLQDIEEITLIRIPSSGHFDRSHLRLRWKGRAGVFKLSLGWEGVEQILLALDHLAPSEFHAEEMG